MPICQLTHTSLYYVEKGQGEPLLFLNGLSGDHLYWMGNLRKFGKRFRCFAVDSRDVGQVPYAGGPYTIKDLAADVAELILRQELGSVHVVGLSMGGMIAQELALGWPEWVRSLALVNTLARADAWFQGTLHAFGLIRRQVPDTASFFEAILSWWVSHCFFEESDRTTWLRWLLRQNPNEQTLEGFLRQLEAIRQHDALERLANIRCPTLILAGTDDKVMLPHHARQMHARIPHAELTFLPGVGHALPIENPGQFNAHLSTFLGVQAKAA